MTPQQALSKLQFMCSKKEYSTGQIRSRLAQWVKKSAGGSGGGSGGKVGSGGGGKGVSCLGACLKEEDFEGIISKLCQDKYVDNNRFANAYVRDKSCFAKWGKTKIVYNLRLLGVDSSCINKALEDNSELFDSNVLKDILSKKLKTIKDSDSVVNKKAKLIRFAISRGFEYDKAMGVVNELL